MCTIVLLRDVISGAPLVVAANRDELYARPASGPEVLARRNQAGAVVAGGRDLAQGGTWMGVTSSGFFAAVTNQKTYTGPVAGRVSRGLLVLELLDLGDPERARAHLEALDARRYHDFNLVYGDASRVEAGYGRSAGAAVEIEEVPQGLHVLTNDRLDSTAFPKVERVAELLEGVGERSLDEARPALAAVLADHRLPPLERVEAPPAGSRFSHGFARELQALCIHTEAYGTRSASLLALAPDRVLRYEFAEGPPCRSSFEDRSALLAPAHGHSAPA